MSSWAERVHRRAADLGNVVTSCGHPGTSTPAYPYRLEKVKFGVPLEEVCKSNDNIPGPLLVLILKLNKESPNRRDVFRAPGHQGAMKKLIHFLQSGRLVNVDNYSVYTIASVLKKFLRKIPNGIFGRVGEKELFEINDLENETEQTERLHRLLASLPKYTQHLLVLLFGTFRVIASNAAHAGTGMTSEALGVSVAPSFFQSCVSDGKTARMEDVLKFKVATKIMQHIIDKFATHDLFGRDNYEYYARVTGRILKVQDEWICSFQYPPPPRGKLAQQKYALQHSLEAEKTWLQCQCERWGLLAQEESRSTPALLTSSSSALENSVLSLGVSPEHSFIESCARLSVSLEGPGLFAMTSSPLPKRAAAATEFTDDGDAYDNDEDNYADDDDEYDRDDDDEDHEIRHVVDEGVDIENNPENAVLRKSNNKNKQNERKTARKQLRQRQEQQHQTHMQQNNESLNELQKQQQLDDDDDNEITVVKRRYRQHKKKITATSASAATTTTTQIQQRGGHHHQRRLRSGSKSLDGGGIGSGSVASNAAHTLTTTNAVLMQQHDFNISGVGTGKIGGNGEIFASYGGAACSNNANSLKKTRTCSRCNRGIRHSSSCSSTSAGAAAAAAVTNNGGAGSVAAGANESGMTMEELRAVNRYAESTKSLSYLPQVHERQTARMRTRSEWFLGPREDGVVTLQLPDTCSNCCLLLAQQQQQQQGQQQHNYLGGGSTRDMRRTQFLMDDDEAYHYSSSRLIDTKASTLYQYLRKQQQQQQINSTATTTNTTTEEMDTDDNTNYDPQQQTQQLTKMQQPQQHSQIHSTKKYLTPQQALTAANGARLLLLDSNTVGNIRLSNSAESIQYPGRRTSQRRLLINVPRHYPLRSSLRRSKEKQIGSNSNATTTTIATAKKSSSGSRDIGILGCCKNEIITNHPTIAVQLLKPPPSSLRNSIAECSCLSNTNIMAAASATFIQRYQHTTTKTTGTNSSEAIAASTTMLLARKNSAHSDGGGDNSTALTFKPPRL